MPIVLIVMRMCPPLFASLVGVGPANERHRPSRADDRIDAIRTSMRPDFPASPRQRYGGAPDECCEYRSEEHTSELQSLMRISYAVFCLKKKIKSSRHQYDIDRKPYKKQ